MKPRKLKSGNWNIRITIHGQTYSFTDPDKNAVRRQASAFAAEVRENIENPPLYKALEDFIEEHRETLSPSTVRSYAGIVRTIRQRHPQIAQKRLVAVTDKDVQDIIKPLRTPKTQRNYVNFIQVATDRKFKVKYKNKPQKHLAIPTELEVAGLAAVFRDTEMEIPILLGAYGGLRRGEICALTIDDLHGDYVRISKDMVLDDTHCWIVKPPKTLTSNRDVLLPHFVAERIRQKGYITTLKPNEITNRLRRKMHSLEIDPPYCFHSLRHFCASYLHAQGIPDEYIMARGGWASSSIMQNVYRHALSDKAVEMENKAAESFQFSFQD